MDWKSHSITAQSLKRVTEIRQVWNKIQLIGFKILVKNHILPTVKFCFQRSAIKLPYFCKLYYNGCQIIIEIYENPSISYILCLNIGLTGREGKIQYCIRNWIGLKSIIFFFCSFRVHRVSILFGQPKNSTIYGRQWQFRHFYPPDF